LDKERGGDKMSYELRKNLARLSLDEIDNLAASYLCGERFSFDDMLPMMFDPVLNMKIKNIGMKYGIAKI